MFSTASRGREAFPKDLKGQPEKPDFTKRCTTVRPTVTIYLDELPG